MLNEYIIVKPLYSESKIGVTQETNGDLFSHEFSLNIRVQDNTFEQNYELLTCIYRLIMYAKLHHYSFAFSFPI